jgi:hypothetical protein
MMPDSGGSATLFRAAPRHQVLFDQAKRTLIDVTAGRGFKALDSAFGRQAFGSLPSREKNVFEI